MTATPQDLIADIKALLAQGCEIRQIDTMVFIELPKNRGGGRGAKTLEEAVALAHWDLGRR